VANSATQCSCAASMCLPYAASEMPCAQRLSAASSGVESFAVTPRQRDNAREVLPRATHGLCCRRRQYPVIHAMASTASVSTRTIYCMEAQVARSKASRWRAAASAPRARSRAKDAQASGC
jgi:hypothetical protein